ncbi:DUF2459 domain-containing protein [Luteolibacter sp. LG18]|uniref:DUF2459 domain-containing protein n=1 Tax=Luteolibacter sp. LG18 TaxID=2819286 RepID=UPI002B2DAD5F|nr:hypothetical protein llg_18640 [Luteolibacter sp. LG18]
MTAVWALLPCVALAFSSCIRIPVSTGTKRVEVAAVSAATPKKVAAPAPQRDPDVLVWMIADNLHTGMVFEYDWLLENGFRPPVGFPKAKYVTMSWGNREAYLKKAWLTPWQAVRALCWPSPSVMEIIPFNYNVVDVCHYQHVWKKLVPRDRGPAVAAFLNGCVKQGPDGNPIVLGTSSWGKGVIVESPWNYSIPRVCNTWTVQVMEACGCEVHPWGAMTEGGVVKQAESRKNGFQKIWDAYDKEDGKE